MTHLGIPEDNPLKGKNWIINDNVVLICNMIVTRYGVVLKKQDVIRFINKNKSDDKNILDALDELKKSIDNEDRDIINKLIGNRRVDDSLIIYRN